MKLRVVMAFAALAFGLPQPVAADSLSPWGMWTDGAQLKPSKRQPPAFGDVPPGFLGASGLAPGAQAQRRAVVELADGGRRPDVAPKEPQVVAFQSEYEAGSVVIDTAGRMLYYILPGDEAYAYPVAVGKEGFTWTGTEKVSKVVDWPDWIPPEEMRQRKPSLPLRMTGGLKNPLGAKAIYLGQSLYRIHGTNDANSIGTAASSGCIRMHNGHVVHLANLITSETVVHVVKRVPSGTVRALPAEPDGAPLGHEQQI